MEAAFYLSLIFNYFFLSLYYSSKPRAMKLAIAQVSETSIPPRENVTYSKETQTQGLDLSDRDGKWHRFHHAVLFN